MSKFLNKATLYTVFCTVCLGWKFQQNLQFLEKHRQPKLYRKPDITISMGVMFELSNFLSS